MFRKYWNCINCGEKKKPDFEEEFSLQCKECKAPLDLKYSEAIKWSDLSNTTQGVLRYEKIIPVSNINLRKICYSDAPEFLPPVEIPNLAKLLDVESVHLLCPILGPSGTFKDVEAAVVLCKCLDWEVKKRLSWHSTGNTARAYREYSMRAGLESDSYFPLCCLDKFKGIKIDLHNLLLAYDGPFQKISAIAKFNAQKFNTLHLAPLRWKIEGKATLAYTIFENLPETNVIVQTIAGGYGVLGLELGIKRLIQLGLLDENNYRYKLFQIDGADTFTKLLPLERDIYETELMLPVNPFEPTLQSTNPLSTFNLVRDVVTRTKSSIDSVTTNEVLQSKEVFEKECLDHGINISFEDEKSPFISWAGLVKAKKDGKLLESDRMVIIVTGSQKRTGEVPSPDYVLRSK
jgi:threonine synthase